MIASAPVLALIASITTCWAERDDPARLFHLAVQAEAIAAVADTPAEAAALVTIAKHEGDFCWSVATGARKGGPGEGPWQLEPGSHRTRPYSGFDVASLSHAAGEALWLWRHSWQCGSSPAARFRAYAGLPCDSKWSGASRRARFFGWANWQLSRLPDGRGHNKA